MTYSSIESGKHRCFQCGDIFPDDVMLCPYCVIPIPAAPFPHAQSAPRDKLTTYNIWAPKNSLWTEWAKSVLFMNFTTWKDDSRLDMPEINWISAAQRDTMVIVDLPGKTGVEESLALARIGFRPVPLYNGMNNEKMIVNVKDIADALYKGSYELETLRIPNDAPPVFMLDSARMISDRKIPGKYDNRWRVFPQDMPSASFLTKQGINRVIVRSNIELDDLLYVLSCYQERKIKILKSSGDSIIEMSVPNPSWFKKLFYRFKATLGLTRSIAGGFGGLIPLPIGRAYWYWKKGKDGEYDYYNNHRQQL